MIEPGFNKDRIGAPNSISDAIGSIFKPIAKTVDKQVDLNRKAYNTLAKKNNKKAEKKALKLKKANAAELKTSKASFTAAPTYKGKKATTPAIKRQNTAAASYIIKGRNLTQEQKDANKVSRSYMTKLPEKGAAGRPNSKAAQKTVMPTTAKLPKATVNKTGARNVRKATKTSTVAKLPAVKKPVAAGRRSNGAPRR